jgi:hypothetical protein
MKEKCPICNDEECDFLENRQEDGKEPPIVLFNGGYRRHGTIILKQEQCVKCNETKLCLSGDVSEDEYASVDICYDCIKSIFENKS